MGGLEVERDREPPQGGFLFWALAALSAVAGHRLQAYAWAVELPRAAYKPMFMTERFEVEKAFMLSSRTLA